MIHPNVLKLLNLTAVILRMIAKKASDRFSSWEAVRSFLATEAEIRNVGALHVYSSEVRALDYKK